MQHHIKPSTFCLSFSSTQITTCNCCVFFFFYHNTFYFNEPSSQANYFSLFHQFSVASEPFPSMSWLPLRAFSPPSSLSSWGPLTADHPPLPPHLRNSPSSVFGSLCWAPVVSEPAGGPVSASPAACQQWKTWISVLEAIMYTYRCRHTWMSWQQNRCVQINFWTWHVGETAGNYMEVSNLLADLPVQTSARLWLHLSAPSAAPRWPGNSCRCWPVWQRCQTFEGLLWTLPPPWRHVSVCS